MITRSQTQLSLLRLCKSNIPKNTNQPQHIKTNYCTIDISPPLCCFPFCEIKPLYDVNIDFDEASSCWRAHKKKLDNGCYVYICGSIMKNGKFCMKLHCRLHKNKTNI